jgi:ABC-2 type transport system permease protein
MMTLKRLWQLFLARNKEFYRDRGSMSWNFLFPVLIIAGFAFAYSGKPKPLFTVGVVGSLNPMVDWQYAKFVAVPESEEDVTKAKEKVGRHQMDILVHVTSRLSGDTALTEGKYWVNGTSPQGDTLEKMLASVKQVEWHREEISGQAIRFVDWLTPGVIGINMMFSALFGVGYVLVRYRKSGVLKRLKATPVRAWEFLMAQILSRFVLISVTTFVIFLGAILILGIPIHGSAWTLALVMAVGTLCLISIGLIVAARVSSEELAGGLLNMMTWPMMFLSGVWFSLEGLNPWLQKASMLSPLTHMVSAARAVMIDGEGLMSPAVFFPLMILSVLAFIGLAVGSWLFRWE